MYCLSLVNYQRIESKKVKIGSLELGHKSPIVIQTMTNTTTKNVDKTVEQSLKCILNGAQLVRITTPTIDDVNALREIIERVKSKFPSSVFVADIHFSPKVAIEAAKIADKIRINPGNFVNSKNYPTLEKELEEVQKKLKELIDVCKQNKTSIRIGTNHGSLSPRILEKYGNTPMGLVQATIEYIQIFEKMGFEDIVISLKSSNPIVMVQSNRLIVEKMKEKNRIYPLHLGVTEAGNKTEGRIKSALGIGALLLDGIGDTIRVSLTEAPQNELPICKKIISYISERANSETFDEIQQVFFDPFSFNKRKTENIFGIGGTQDCKVVVKQKNSKIEVNQLEPDFVVVDNENQKMMIRKSDFDNNNFAQAICIISPQKYITNEYEKCAIFIDLKSLTDELIQKIKIQKNSILIFKPISNNKVGEIRTFFYKLHKSECHAPVILEIEHNEKEQEDFEIKSAIDTSVFLIDGLIDGLLLINKSSETTKNEIDTAFEILQASHRRISKTEFISCPSCGRTLFDIEEVAERVQNATKHLKGLKIAIMGCIVNGPGELADADYGYVGAGKNLVNLYKGKEPVKININEINAVEELINIIKENGQWKEPSQKN